MDQENHNKNEGSCAAAPPAAPESYDQTNDQVNPVVVVSEAAARQESTSESKSSQVSVQTRFTFLEQIRDFTYKDVVLADTKAGISLTIVAASVAAYAALFEKLSQAKQPWLQLAHTSGVLGLLCGIVSVLCAMLTILPRSYISHEMATNPSHWIQMRGGVWHGLRRRFLDAVAVILENVWQRQTKGTPQSLEMLLKPELEQGEVNEVMYVSMRRAVLVQNLKFLWVGKSILFAFWTFILVGISILFGVLPSLSSLLPFLPNAAA